MKWLFNIISAILILVGIVWFLQGINILLGSFMSGDPLYSLLGILLVVVGMIVLVFANRWVGGNLKNRLIPNFTFERIDNQKSPLLVV